jgi:hypothetical protein
VLIEPGGRAFRNEEPLLDEALLAQRPLRRVRFLPPGSPDTADS